MVMGGGLIQLVAFGAQDVYFNENYNKYNYVNKKKFEGKNNFYKKVKNTTHKKSAEYFATKRMAKNDKHNCHKTKPKQSNIISTLENKEKNTTQITPKKDKLFGRQLYLANKKVLVKQRVRKIINDNLLLKMKIIDALQITPKNIECPILLGNIEKYFIQCNTCMYCFDSNAFVQCKCQNNGCPICKTTTSENISFGIIDKSNIDIYDVILKEKSLNLL